MPTLGINKEIVEILSLKAQASMRSSYTQYCAEVINMLETGVLPATINCREISAIWVAYTELFLQTVEDAMVKEDARERHGYPVTGPLSGDLKDRVELLRMGESL